MKCPHDGTTLTTTRHEAGVMVDECPQCHGIWLDKGELEAAEERLEQDHADVLRRLDSVAQAYEMARQRARAGKPTRCPRCHDHLHAQEYAYCSHVLIDRCGKCGGVWLDAGELETLEAFFERETGAREPIRRGFFASLLRLFD